MIILQHYTKEDTVHLNHSVRECALVNVRHSRTLLYPSLSETDITKSKRKNYVIRQIAH